MSGDIDIEEHDLMENPKIRSIFPDLTLLKKEILDPQYEESMQHSGLSTDTVIDRTNRFNNPPICKTNLNIANYSNINIKQEIKIEKETTNDQLDFRLSSTEKSNNVPFLSFNKIVLGSKPSRPSYDKKLGYDIRISLEDINNYLIKSECYCVICQILFPTIHTFEHHTFVNHKTDKTDESDKILNNPFNQCFHCNVLYPSQGLLIEHLYDVLEKKRAGIPEKVIVNYETIPDNTDVGKIIPMNYGGRKKAISKEYESQIKSVDSETCKKQSLNGGECGTISEASRGSQIIFKQYIGRRKPVESKTCERITIDDGENETISDDVTDCATISVDAKDEIEILCDINRDEVFQCEICTYYFHKQNYYKKHMLRKHDVKIKKINIVKFNTKCKFCSKLYIGVKQYNTHLHKSHSNMIFRAKSESEISSNQIDQMHRKYEKKPERNVTQSIYNPVSPMIENPVTNIDLLSADLLVFKSVLFKCLKCDVHFLSANLAASHDVHNEMLINWKCSLCKIFFKKNDEALHSKQHLNCKLFTIYNLDAIVLTRILVKCSKCAVYFPHNNFAYHLKICNTVELFNINIKSWYCYICDVGIQIIFKETHKSTHNNKSNKKSDFIFIDDSIINTQTTNSNEQTSEINEVEKSTTESEESEDDAYGADESENNYPITNLKVMNQPRAVETPKRKIDDAQNSISTKNFKRLKINNTDKNIFYSKLNSKSHIQPRLLLNLTYCHYCECFVSMYYKRNIHIEKRCIHILKRVCSICGLTLTSKAIGGHRDFHKMNPGLKLQDFTFYDIETNEVILPPIPKYPKCDNCDTHFINRTAICSHVCNETQHILCDICDMKFCNVAFNLHISFHGYYIKSSSSSSSIEEISEVVRTIRIEVESNSVKEQGEVDQSKNSERFVGIESEQNIQSKHVEMEHNDQCDVRGKVLMYMCENCSLTVNSYDQLIEHCHSHYDNSYRNIATKECAQCNLIFEYSLIPCHNKLHVNGLTKELYRIFAVDIFNFGRSNLEWLKHVFKSLSDDKIEEIIKNSIYRFEHRVKLDAIQQGSPEFTLYQCIKCNIFIDGWTIYKHRQICQGDNKKYPCRYCGIPLLSTALRSQHNKIHEHANVGIKSYRIVAFNSVKDKTLNDALAMNNNHYVLHQCRICNGVVDWKLLKTHKCNIEDLKKCNNCGLLICNDDYDKHVSKHESFNTFITSNMKVVLFGQSTMDSNERNNSACSFNGIVYDYTLYKCIKCDVCIQNLRPSSKHYCLIDAAKWKCPKCDLVFDEGKRKGHRAIHNSDIEFTKDNICVIPFDPLETYERLEKELRCKSKTGSLVREKDPEDIVDSIVEKTDIMYKCSCGLHYLTEESAKVHALRKRCMYMKKSTKQTCSKCNFVFTSETLFKHLLKHHGDKNTKYTFNIVNVCEESDSK